MSLTTERKTQPSTSRSHPVLAVHTTSSVSSANRDTPQNEDVTREWKQVRATVLGNHEIPDRTAMHIPVSVLNAPVGCDVCIEGPSQLQRLSIEATLTTVRDGPVVLTTKHHLHLMYIILFIDSYCPNHHQHDSSVLLG